MSSKQRGRSVVDRPSGTIVPNPQASSVPQDEDYSNLVNLPTTYQSLVNFIEQRGNSIDASKLRLETFKRIEAVTGRPILCYASKTHNISPSLPTSIDDSDLMGFDDFSQSIKGSEVDIFIISNGGSAEATERIVRLLHERFLSIRFIIPGNAYSAATLMCLSGQEIIMTYQGTIGPIDPQINGIPARSIVRAFESIEKRLADEGPRALTAYLPLLEKYDLHMLEICKSAEALSRELANTWLAEYHLNTPKGSPQIEEIVQFLVSYDLHKSHARSISRDQAHRIGLKITKSETNPLLDGLIRSLYVQYELLFDQSPFIKMFENNYGINWGRQAAQIAVQIPHQGHPIPPQPGPPHPAR